MDYIIQAFPWAMRQKPDPTKQTDIWPSLYLLWEATTPSFLFTWTCLKISIIANMIKSTSFNSQYHWYWRQQWFWWSYYVTKIMLTLGWCDIIDVSFMILIAESVSKLLLTWAVSNFSHQNRYMHYLKKRFGEKSDGKFWQNSCQWNKYLNRSHLQSRWFVSWKIE